MTRRFGLNHAEVNRVEKAAARRLLLDRSSDQRAWLDTALVRLSDPELVELRARLAIWEQDWRGLEGWVKRMPMGLQKEDRWRYWMARSLEKQGGRNRRGTSISRLQTCAASTASWRPSAPVCPIA